MAIWLKNQNRSYHLQMIMRNNESKKLVIRGEKSNRSSLSSLYDAADYSQKRREEIDRSTLSV